MKELDIYTEAVNLAASFLSRTGMTFHSSRLNLRVRFSLGYRQFISILATSPHIPKTQNHVDFSTWFCVLLEKFEEMACCEPHRATSRTFVRKPRQKHPSKFSRKLYRLIQADSLSTEPSSHLKKRKEG